MTKFAVRIFLSLAACAIFAACSMSQQSSSSSTTPAASAAPAMTNSPEQQAKEDKEKEKQEKKARKEREKKEKAEAKAKKDEEKKDKDTKSGRDVVDTSVFSAAVANDVMGTIRDGLEGHSQRLMLSAFDSDKMDGYLVFEDRIEALFNRYESFRIHFRIAQTSIEGNKGVVLVDVQMEEVPRAATTAPIRKANQMRFELEKGRKGWKVVDFRPRDFFS